MRAHQTWFCITMASLQVIEISENVQSSTHDKIGVASESKEQHPNSGFEKLHFVPRNDELPNYDLSEESIVGYDADLMRARATLSRDEEKKVMRRVDWHLLPLLAVMYAVKTIDAMNVCSQILWS